MKYRLCFENRQIGFVERLDSDFPSISGTYEILPSVENDEKLIWDYVQFSIEADILFDIDEKKGLVFRAEGESNFMALINSEEWSLIDENEKTHKMLIPIFCDKHEIVWRWNF